jgi:hypothetical protein
MRKQRLWLALGVLAGLATLGSVALSRAQFGGAPWFTGGACLLTFTDGQGNFLSREVVALHADRTMSAVDSGQNGPQYLYSSQLGVWKPDGPGKIIARTFDFDYPPNADLARIDFVLNLTPDRRHLAGTVRICTFPLETEDAQDGGCSAGVTYNVAGEFF